MEQYDVFICYRRDGGEMLAHILYEKLTEAGYSVFQDIESLRSGNFNEALYDVIDNCNDVIVVLPPDGLKRCNNEDDWVRCELKRAIEKGKNIVPVTMRGFEWPEKLPDDIDELRNKNAISANPEYFKYFIEKLFKFLNSKSKKKVRTKIVKHKLRDFFEVLFSALIVISPVLLICVFNQPFLLYQRIIYAILLILIVRHFLNKLRTDPHFASACYGTIKEDDLAGTVDQLYSNMVSAFNKRILISNKVPQGYTDYCTLKQLEFGSWNENKTINYLKVFYRGMFRYYSPGIFYINAKCKANQAIRMLVKNGFLIQTMPDGFSSNVDYLKNDNFHVFLYYKWKRLDYAVLYNCSNEELTEKLKEENKKRKK